LTVTENLELGAYTPRARDSRSDTMAEVYDTFPRLAERKSQKAGTLSGGERQMLAIGKALMARPELLILDEPSLGLAPKLVQTIRDIVVEVNKQGTAVLLIEQNARMALSIAHHGYVMETGRIVLDGPAEKLLKDEDVKEFYLGLGAAGSRKSFREVKHYKRRKRWLS
jgi:branched-chain amino acid transport system ATP-binding protein